MKCAIVVDTYKLPVYERHLKQALILTSENKHI